MSIALALIGSLFFVVALTTPPTLAAILADRTFKDPDAGFVAAVGAMLAVLTVELAVVGYVVERYIL